MKKLIYRSLAAATLLIGSGFVYQNCGELSANPGDDAEKLAFISKRTVFGVTQADAVKEIARAGAENETSLVKQVTGTIKVTNFCTNSFNYNLGTVGSTTAKLLNAIGQTACELNSTQVRDFLLNMDSVALPTLRQQCGESFQAGNYTLTLTQAGTSNHLLFSDNPVVNPRPGLNLQFGVSVRDGNETISLSSGRAYVLYHYNNGSVAGVSASGSGARASASATEGTQSATEAAKCMEAGEVPPPPPADPLLIQLSDGATTRQVRLSPITKGVFFDIMGDAGMPAAHVKQLISWFADTASASYNAWLVKPNGYGQVNGVDEMLGDRTLGPDGTHAPNGFEALRKWDGRLNYIENGQVAFSSRYRDGKIDANDAVFSELRLWMDKNNDGVAEPEELVSLETAGVVSIDLNYDPNFSEKDVYGNEIKFKSVVRMRDGRLNLIYDIFFRTL